MHVTGVYTYSNAITQIAYGGHDIDHCSRLMAAISGRADPYIPDFEP
jgi:hypothetical protein